MRSASLCWPLGSAFAALVVSSNVEIMRMSPRGFSIAAGSWVFGVPLDGFEDEVRFVLANWPCRGTLACGAAGVGCLENCPVAIVCTVYFIVQFCHFCCVSVFEIFRF